MSRVAKAPVTVPNSVTVTQNGRQVEVKGSKGTLSFNLHALVEQWSYPWFRHHDYDHCS